jgi:hypothetical protein
MTKPKRWSTPSQDFESLLVKKLGRGGACPHGNFGIVDSPAQKRRRGYKPLSEAESGQSYAVVSVYERDSKLGELLDRRLWHSKKDT